MLVWWCFEQVKLRHKLWIFWKCVLKKCSVYKWNSALFETIFKNNIFEWNQNQEHFIPEYKWSTLMLPWVCTSILWRVKNHRLISEHNRIYKFYTNFSMVLKFFPIIFRFQKYSSIYEILDRFDLFYKFIKWFPVLWYCIEYF